MLSIYFKFIIYFEINEVYFNLFVVENNIFLIDIYYIFIS